MADKVGLVDQPQTSRDKRDISAFSQAGEYGPAQATRLQVCVAWFMDLTLRRPGFDFASTRGF
jgi:hypothetical protein